MPEDRLDLLNVTTIFTARCLCVVINILFAARVANCVLGVSWKELLCLHEGPLVLRIECCMNNWKDLEARISESEDSVI